MSFDYFKFLLKSTNQHGVHSPFVYQFVTECLYKKDGFTGTKTQKVFFKSLSFLKAQKVLLRPNDPSLWQALQKHFDIDPLDAPPFDLIYVHMDQTLGIIDSLGLYHNDSMVLVPSIYDNKESRKTWEIVKNHQNVNVSLDMYHCGALFFRKEQVKQHFVIRI